MAEAQESDERFVRTLEECVEALAARDIDYVLIGGIASATLGRPRETKDIDVFVKEEDIKKAVAALERAGFDTKEPELDWLYKANKHDVPVDVIFKGSNDVYLDDEMSKRALEREFKGVSVRLVPAEDLVVMKALSHEEETPQYWHDALAIISSNEPDWDYLLRRAERGPRRILSLLIYAESMDLVVPDEVIRRLFARVYDA